MEWLCKKPNTKQSNVCHIARQGYQVVASAVALDWISVNLIPLPGYMATATGMPIECQWSVPGKSVNLIPLPGYMANATWLPIECQCNDTWFSQILNKMRWNPSCQIKISVISPLKCHLDQVCVIWIMPMDCKFVNGLSLNQFLCKFNHWDATSTILHCVEGA